MYRELKQAKLKDKQACMQVGFVIRRVCPKCRPKWVVRGDDPLPLVPEALQGS